MFKESMRANPARIEFLPRLSRAFEILIAALSFGNHEPTEKSIHQ
jgi:hypothetical protein